MSDALHLKGLQGPNAKTSHLLEAPTAIDDTRLVIARTDPKRGPLLLVDADERLRVAVLVLAGLGRRYEIHLPLVQIEPLGDLVSLLVDAVDDRDRAEVGDGPSFRRQRELAASLRDELETEVEVPAVPDGRLQEVQRRGVVHQVMCLVDGEHDLLLRLLDALVDAVK